GRYTSAARALTAVGAALVVVPAARRSRLGSALAGVSLLAGSAATRFGIFHAGQQSALDPRYTVVPQRERLG
ncbi:MAG TPA: polysulfide reductase, partial [Pseudonocardia sp.]